MTVLSSPLRKNLPQQLKILPASCLFSADSLRQTASHAESCTDQGHVFEGGSQETACPGRGIKALPFWAQRRATRTDSIHSSAFLGLPDAVEAASQSTSPSAQSCFLSAAAAAKSLKSCPTLCDPIDGSPPGCSLPGILQARILEWVAISFLDPDYSQALVLISSQSLLSGEPICNHAVLV